MYSQALTARPTADPSLLAWLSVPVVLWAMLWFGIDTGPWMLRRVPSGLLEWAHFIRTLFPFIVLGALCTLPRIRRDLPPISGPLVLWLVYGLIALLASVISSPRPLPDALYWAGVYLAVFAGLIVCLADGDPLTRARQLNHLSWLITTAFLIVLVFLAREYLADAATSAYGIRRGVGETEVGVAVPRSTGAARFAAVPGILGFTLLLAARGPWWRGLGLAAFIAAAFLIYLFQARTVTFGFGAAIALVMIFYSAGTRTAGFVIGTGFACLLLSELIPQEQLDRFLQQIFRGDPHAESVRTFGGRLRPWENALHESWNSPIWGFGHQSDRVLLGELSHNTFIYALMAGGYIGATLFLVGLMWAWRLFFRIRAHAARLSRIDHVMTIQAGAILLFFTLRSVTELSGVSFSVDTMLLVPIVAYFTLLDRELRQGWANAPAERGEPHAANTFAAPGPPPGSAASFGTSPGKPTDTWLTAGSVAPPPAATGTGKTRLRADL